MTQNTVLLLGGSGVTDEIRERCLELCEQLGLSLDIREVDDSNEAGALIVHPAAPDGSGTGNPYQQVVETFVSASKPVVEVHDQNIFSTSSTSLKPLQGPGSGVGFICGLGVHGYLLAIRSIADQIQGQKP